MNSYVEDFIRVSNQTRLKKYVYVKFREWYLQVWKVTRIEYWVLIGALLYAYRFFHGTFDTR